MGAERYRFLGPQKAMGLNTSWNEFNAKATVTCNNANQVYRFTSSSPVATVGGTALIDGTNQLGHVEIIVTLNGFTQPTGTSSAVTVQLFRTNTSGSTSGLTLLDTFGMDAQSVVRIPAKLNLATTHFGIATDTSASTFCISMKGVYK